MQNKSFSFYQKLLIPLLEKIKRNQKLQAEKFLDVFLLKFKEEVARAPIEIEIWLGIINKMYDAFKLREDHSVRLQEFSRELMGLAILYSKSAYDLAVWGIDFLPVYEVSEISEALNLKQLIAQFEKNLEDGRIKFKGKHADKRCYPVILALSRLERDMYRKLDSEVTINFYHLYKILQSFESTELIEEFSEIITSDGSWRENDVNIKDTVFADFFARLKNINDKIEYDAGVAESFPTSPIGNASDEKNLEISNTSKPTCAYSFEEADFAAQLCLIELKTKELEEKAAYDGSYTKAAEVAKTLNLKLNESFNAYLKTNDPNIFKRNSLEAIKTAKPLLEKYYGWGQILANVILAIFSGGVFFVGAGLINKAVTGNFFFFSSKPILKLDKVEESVKHLAPSA